MPAGRRWRAWAVACGVASYASQLLPCTGRGPRAPAAAKQAAVERRSGRVRFSARCSGSGFGFGAPKPRPRSRRRAARKCPCAPPMPADGPGPGDRRHSFAHSCQPRRRSGPEKREHCNSVDPPNACAGARTRTGCQCASPCPLIRGGFWRTMTIGDRLQATPI